MPDITMCTGEKNSQICPKRTSCRRFLSTPSEYQSYFIDAPFEKDDCEYYWHTVKKDVEIHESFPEFDGLNINYI